MLTRSSVPFFLLRRGAAFLYDCLLLLAIFFIITALLVVGINEGEAITHPAFFVLLYVVGLAFFSICWMNGGQTLGMKAWHIQMRDASRGKLTLWQCTVSYLLGTLTFGFTYLHALYDNDHRTLHDRLSKTRIIKIG